MTQKEKLKAVELEVRVLDVIKEYSKSVQKEVDWSQLEHDLINVAIVDLNRALKTLSRLGMIKVTSQLVDQDSTYNVYEYVKDLSERNQLILKEKKRKYVKWLKKADKYMDFMGHKTVKMICYEQDEQGL